MGAGVIESDKLSHEEMGCDEVKRAVWRWWGNDVLLANGSIDRAKVAAHAFADPQERHRLEALLHPRIAVRREHLIAELDRQAGIRMIVIDSPLLYESDLDLICDAVVF